MSAKASQITQIARLFVQQHAQANKKCDPLWGESISALFWRHNEHDSVSNHQPHECLLNLLFRRRSKKTSKLRVTGLCVGNSPGTGEFPAQMASNAENVSIWWRHHGSLNSPHTGSGTRKSDMCDIKYGVGNIDFWINTMNIHYVPWICTRFCCALVCYGCVVNFWRSACPYYS